MRTRKNVRVVVGGLIAVVFLAAAGWVAAGQIKSPAQIAADTAAPSASLLTASVERRSLSTEVIVRGTGRYGKPEAISLPSSALKTSTQLISRIAKPDAVLREGSTAMTVSGRPVFVLQGATPMHRDLGPGDSGEDVRQLERALARAGYRPGAIDGRYEGATAGAVARMYRAHRQAPFGLTEAQRDKLSTAAATVSSATDRLLQMRLALRTATRGAAPADVNQARVDAAAVKELIPPARAAVGAASSRIGDARDLAAIAKRQETEGDGTARRDVATAQVDVTTKQTALNDALTAQSEAQRAVDVLDPAATPAEVEAARAALRVATSKVPNARSELAASQDAYKAAQNVLAQSSTKARDDGRKAARDLALAQSDLREAQRTLATLEHKYRLAQSRVRILTKPANTVIERESVTAAARELDRSEADYGRLAARSGVQVPADEILFFAQTPVRVDTVTGKRGTPVSGDLMTVSNTTLAIDAGLSPQDAKLVKAGQPVHIEDVETAIDVHGRVTRVADRPGTNPQLADPTKTAIEVTPRGADKRLVNTSVRLTIAIKSTKGKVLTVPLNALSVAADGQSRVQVAAGGGRTRIVLVNPGLAAQGNVEVAPKRRGALKEGDSVVIGERSSTAAGRAPTGSQVPSTPPGVSTTQSSTPPASSSGSSAPPATSAPSTPATGTPTTPDSGGGAPTGTTATPGGTRGP